MILAPTDRPTHFLGLEMMRTQLICDPRLNKFHKMQGRVFLELFSRSKVFSARFLFIYLSDVIRCFVFAIAQSTENEKPFSLAK